MCIQDGADLPEMSAFKKVSALWPRAPAQFSETGNFFYLAATDSENLTK